MSTRQLLLVLGCAACAGSPPSPTSATPTPPRASAEPAPSSPPTPELALPMARLDFLRGVWKGSATGLAPDGSRYQVTQQERVTPGLGGDVVMIEGRGVQADGATVFSALGIVSFDPSSQKYELRSYAQGRSGTFELKLTPTGYVWEIPAGPTAVIRYTATFDGARWREVGEFTEAGQPPMPLSEMNLVRVEDAR